MRNREARAPEGERLYVIGDIHGCSGLLAALMDIIAEDDAASDPGCVSRLIFLGDYIDRGPDSREVIEMLCAIGEMSAGAVFLKGNHEALLLNFLFDGRDYLTWTGNGGLETLSSYGLSNELLRAGPPEAVRRALARAMPERHASFIDGLQLSYASGDYFFAHAGVKPGAPLEAQKERDLIWIREPFLSCDDDFGKIVVHGHTPEDEPQIRANRIGIDTGACWTGRLTALALEGSQRRFLSV